MGRIYESTFTLLFTLTALTLGVASCSDSSDKSSVVKPGGSSTEPAATTPIPGIDVSKLAAAKQKHFYELAASLPSPCGKAHSLRTSATKDQACKRSKFALRHVVEMLRDEASDAEIQQSYLRRFAQTPRATFKLDDTIPHVGPADAPVQLVEFYDYACPACKRFAPMLDEVVSDMQGQVVLYYRQFPLSQHPHSKSAAQAALAAHAQGKFKQMHELLFANAPQHERSQLTRYAQSLGLDMAKYEADFAAATPRVDIDNKEGLRANIRSTPSLYINGRLYQGPPRAKHVKMWIEEELDQ